MISETLFGAAGVALLAAGWLAVQLAWGRDFPGDGSEPDVLARRGGCGGCGHGGRCERACRAEGRGEEGRS